MRTSCPHLSLSLSLSCLRRTSAMPFGSWPCAHANSTLLARSLAFDLVLLHARALNIKQQHSESSRSPVVSVRKNCTSLSLSLFHIITPSTRISMHACVSLRERLTSIACVVDAGRLCDGDAMHLSRFRTVFSRMGLPVLAYISPRLRWSVCSALCMSRVSMREYTY